MSKILEGIMIDTQCDIYVVTGHKDGTTGNHGTDCEED